MGFIWDKRLMVFYDETEQVWTWRTIGSREDYWEQRGLLAAERTIENIFGFIPVFAYHSSFHEL